MTNKEEVRVSDVIEEIASDETVVQAEPTPAPPLAPVETHKYPPHLTLDELLTGKTVEEATEIAKDRGLTLRVVSYQNVPAVITRELMPMRINVDVVDGVVVGVQGRG